MDKRTFWVALEYSHGVLVDLKLFTDRAAAKDLAEKHLNGGDPDRWGEVWEVGFNDPQSAELDSLRSKLAQIAALAHA